MASIRAPFPYFGGKQALVPTLLNLLPPHDVYVEVFGGAASLLFSKSPAKLEVYNDLDSGLVNFFRVLRDPKQAKELRRLLDLTPYSREERAECRVSWMRATSDVEMARQWFVLVQQGFAGRVDAGCGWRFTKKVSHNPAQSYRTAIDTLPQFTKRLRNVLIEHHDFAQMFALYDSPDALFYCDPPYVPETRRSHGYRHDMTMDDHVRLLATIRGAQGAVVLSGYRSALYDDALVDWQHVEVKTVNRAANTTQEARTECIWLSPHGAPAQVGLWQQQSASEEGVPA